MKSIDELLINEEYNACRVWINNARSSKKTWEEIFYGCKNDDAGLEKFINNKCEDDFWSITFEEWKILVNEMRKVEDASTGGFIGDPKKPWISVPTSTGSCWQNYKKKLEKNHFTYLSISNIEKSSQKVISYLSETTEQNDPVRGMVVGNVQSGKTSNMAGVIAMAADYGYNFFIILTGTIDNLRVQTRKRLLSDLNHPGCNLVFESLDYLSSKTTNPHRLQDLFLTCSNRRYITVCLKNSTRLKELLNWLNKDQKAKENLKVLIIDDEADQAGVNTKDVDSDEQTAISRLIKNVVFGRNAKDIKQGNYKCMNYIGYTATPYANFLNESGADTLYPKNFISLLSPSPEYFGPQQIFGISGINDPLNIVNNISNEDIDAINNDESVLSGNIPASLKQAILWFTITVACFRYYKLGKPVSMLIHTSQKVERHDAVSKAIQSFLNGKNYDALEEELIKVYNEQTSLLSLDDFKRLMDDYNELDFVKDYPKFDDLKQFLQDLLNQTVTHIGLDDDEQLTYSKGLHLCVDNCSRKRIEDDSIEMRIVYPEDEHPIIKESPAFIVIGGATLSRGLTLQGLTTSYFLRSTSQADTLMQMGRWFGYRKGYELLQRLWLSNDTYSRFNRLTKLDYDLRQELYSMELKGLSPKNYGPKLDSFPDYKLLVITAKNKRQSTVECQTTFYNKTAQTTWFHRDNSIINSNYDRTIDFLNSLGNIDKEKMNSLKNPYIQDNSIMWFDVDYAKVIDYLKDIKIPHQSASFDDYDKLKEWYKGEYEKGVMSGWTVIAGSVKEKIHNDVVLDNGITIHLENRTRIERKNLVAEDPHHYDNIIDLNTIHQPADRLMDIDCSSMDADDKEQLNGNKKKFIEKRIKYASKQSPLLIVYIVDKDSEVDKATPPSAAYNRYSLKSLKLEKHIVGYYLYIPYGEGENEGFVTIKLDYEPEKDGETNEA